MSLAPSEEIGEEVHKLDQFFRVEEGTREAVLEGFRTAIGSGFAIIVPAGTNHNIINTGSVPVKIYTLYSPPESQCPFRTVAHLLLPRQEIDILREDDNFKSLSFSVWHALESHRPLGGINRVRRAVYEISAKWRRQQMGEITDTSNRGHFDLR